MQLLQDDDDDGGEISKKKKVLSVSAGAPVNACQKMRGLSNNGVLFLKILMAIQHHKQASTC